MSLTTLPLLPLEKIASHLDFSSLVSLASSSSSVAFLQPKEQIVKGENFYVAGISLPHALEAQIRFRRGQTHFPSLLEKRRNPDPEHFFDVVVETQGLLGIKLVWEWDGTNIFTKAQIWLQLVREERVRIRLYTIYRYYTCQKMIQPKLNSLILITGARDVPV